LLARVSAVLRRSRGAREGPRRVGELVTDTATRSVRIGERPVRLANKEFALLRALASDPTRVFTKGEPLRDVWNYRSLGRTRALDRAGRGCQNE
jgi:two-component system OmpR family response regulator